MKVPVAQAPKVITEYLDSMVMPEALKSGGLRAFTVGFIGGLAARQAPQMVNQYLPIAKALNVVDENGNLDIDLAYDEATKALSKAPLEIGGYKVDQTDLDAMKSIMAKYAV